MSPETRIEWRRDDFPVLVPVDTRWSDNDVFGHLNNAVYYQLFDSVINRWLGERTGLSPMAMPALGVVAESGCTYYREVGYPQALEVGLAVARLGRSSVTYRLGLLAAGASELAALGRWTHVYIERQTRRPVAIPPVIREPLQALVVPAER